MKTKEKNWLDYKEAREENTEGLKELLKQLKALYRTEAKIKNKIKDKFGLNVNDTLVGIVLQDYNGPQQHSQDCWLYDGFDNNKVYKMYIGPGSLHSVSERNNDFYAVPITRSKNK